MSRKQEALTIFPLLISYTRMPNYNQLNLSLPSTYGPIQKTLSQKKKEISAFLPFRTQYDKTQQKNQLPYLPNTIQYNTTITTGTDPFRSGSNVTKNTTTTNFPS